MVVADDLNGLRRKLAALLPHLDERQRRLVLGAEARALGHGGIKKVAVAAQVSAVTVSRGIAELDAGSAPLRRTRRPGGGRKKLVITDPGLQAALLDVLAALSPESPPGPLLWTTQSLRDIVAELAIRGHRVSAPTVASLLRQESFSLSASTHSSGGSQRAEREAQYRYINYQAAAHMAARHPVISLDARKLEPTGAPDAAEGAARLATGLPTGEAPGPGSAWSVVAGDAGTAAYAVAAIRSWWARVGQAAYPAATGLMVCPYVIGPADFYGSAWQAELATLADDTRLRITCCHLPSGTSRWQRFEHRFFAAVTETRPDRPDLPAARHEAVIGLVASPATVCPSQETPSDADDGRQSSGTDGAGRRRRDWPGGPGRPDQIRLARLRRHDWHPRWNYSIVPADP